MRTALGRLIPCALLLLPSVGAASSAVRGAAIRSYAALPGKFAFIQPDGSLTVLDSATGKVLFHGPKRVDERYSWNSFFDTRHGLVVRSYRWKLLTKDESVYRMLDFEKKGVVWEVASNRDCHVGEDYLICPDRQGRLVARQLADGRELWSYRAETATAEVLDRGGRVMVSAHDEDRRWRDGEDGSKVLSSRDRIRSVAILEGRTGKELMAARGLDVVVAPIAYGTSVFSFDGTRAVVDAISWDGSCAGRLLHTFRPDTAGTALVSEERCAPAEKPPERSPAFHRIAKQLGGFDRALGERDGRVFVARTFSADGQARLECLDGESGKVLWTYSFVAPGPTPFY
jgi:outer membrane protein assembly factor BamB